MAQSSVWSEQLRLCFPFNLPAPRRYFHSRGVIACTPGLLIHDESQFLPVKPVNDCREYCLVTWYRGFDVSQLTGFGPRCAPSERGVNANTCSALKTSGWDVQADFIWETPERSVLTDPYVKCRLLPVVDPMETTGLAQIFTLISRYSIIISSVRPDEPS